MAEPHERVQGTSDTGPLNLPASSFPAEAAPTAGDEGYQALSLLALVGFVVLARMHAPPVVETI